MSLPPVVATDATKALVRKLLDQHGPLMFHLSGGCCDGSAPMCLPAGELRLGARDILLGEIEGCPFYTADDHPVLRTDFPVVIDVVPGRGASFSLEIPEGVRFILRAESCPL